MGRGKNWSAEEIALLTDNVYLSNRVLADKIGRSPSAVRNFRTRLLREGVIEYKGSAPKASDWTDYDLNFVKGSPGTTDQELASALGRSMSAICNVRMRQRRAEGIPARPKVPTIPNQELHDRPPGVYVEVVGRVLLEFPDAMDNWLHAHGYSSFEIKFEDSLGWTTLTCVKEN